MCSFKKNVIEYVQISQLIMIYLKKNIFNNIFSIYKK